MAWSDHAGQRFHKAFFLISLEGRNVRYPSEGLGRVVEVQFSAGKWSTPRSESPPRIETSSFQSRPWQSARFPTEVGMSIVADRRRQILPADARANYERLTLGAYPRAGHSVLTAVETGRVGGQPTNTAARRALSNRTIGRVFCQSSLGGPWGGGSPSTPEWRTLRLASPSRPHKGWALPVL